MAYTHLDLALRSLPEPICASYFHLAVVACEITALCFLHAGHYAINPYVVASTASSPLNQGIKEFIKRA